MSNVTSFPRPDAEIRTSPSILLAGPIMSRKGTKHWSKIDRERLRMFWASQPRSELLRMFPGRSWHALDQKARKLGLSRPWKWDGHESPPISALMEQLREAREKRDLTATQLSAMIGLSERYVSNAEKGALNPNMHTVERWCAALGVGLKVVESGRGMHGRS